jgi:hypothetical protein
MLFEMANKFFIRHNKPHERRDYDRDVWLDWMFVTYLSSIRLVQRLSQAEEQDS